MRDARLLEDSPILFNVAGRNDERDRTLLVCVRRQSADLGKHLYAEGAVRVEEDKQHLFASPLGKRHAAARQQRQLKVVEQRTDRYALQEVSFLIGYNALRLQFLFERFEPQLESAILHKKLIAKTTNCKERYPQEYLPEVY